MISVLSLLLAAVLAVCPYGSENAVQDGFKYIEASELTMLGKLFDDIPNPYHRVDTCRFKGFTPKENMLMRFSTGLAVAFRTDAESVNVYTEYGERGHQSCTTDISARGYDLYIKTADGWMYAASKEGNEGVVNLISNMDGKMKECIMYLPMYSELYSCRIGVPEGAVLEALPSPFRHRVAVYGSSFTHGVGTSRSGMVLLNQFTRRTGIQLLSLACSGNCLMQPYFADVLNEAEIDAIIFDTFSNPRAPMIEERLIPFVESIRRAHPDIPLIFMRTIHKASTHFDREWQEIERQKAETAERLMKEVCRRYENVYFITPTANDANHDTSVDGTHPDNYGYRLWERSVERRIQRILRRNGLK